MSRIIIIFVLLVFFTGCATFTPAPAISQWTTITLNHSGGFIGLSRSIEISHDGKFVVSDDRAKQSIRGELSAQELSALNNLIASVASIPVATPKQSGCADCFVYALQIQGSGKNPGVQFDDVTLPESGFESLVIFLRDLIDKSLK